MTDIRITGLTRVVHRDGPGPLRVARVYRVVHRDPATNPTQVRVVRVYREVMYQSHVPVQFTEGVGMVVGITPLAKRSISKAPTKTNVGATPRITRGITRTPLTMSVQATPVSFKTFVKTFKITVNAVLDFKLHHHILNIIRGLFRWPELKGVVADDAPPELIRAWSTNPELKGVVDAATTSEARAVANVNEVRAYVED